MASTPTLTVSAPGVYVLVEVSTSSGTDRIEAWRYGSDGEPVRVAYSITTASFKGTWLGSFNDYNIASGRTHRYFLRAVDGSGGTADSAVKSVDFTLTEGHLHSVTKTNRDSNASVTVGGGASAGDYDLIPQSQGYNRAGQVRMLGNNTLPSISQSGIEQGLFSLTFRTTNPTVTMRQIFTARGIVCYRNALGWLAFGRLVDYRETPSYTYTDVSINVEVLDYDESVNA